MNLSDLLKINLIPVKATGAEINTGTDDAKFATAKALKDSHNVPSVAPSTSGNILTSDGTDWISSEPAGGGMWTYVSKLSWANANTTQSFSSLSAHDHWLLVFNVHNNATNARLGIQMTLNSISTNTYNIRKIDSSAVTTLASQPQWTIISPNNDGYNIACGQLIITGKHSNGVKMFSSTLYDALNFPDSISGSLTGDNADVSAIAIIPNAAITGQVELWYKDNK